MLIALRQRLLRRPMVIALLITIAGALGLAFGLSKNLPLDVTGRVAALAATYAIELKGCQEHAFTKPAFLSRYVESFGASPQLAAALA